MTTGNVQSTMGHPMLGRIITVVVVVLGAHALPAADKDKPLSEEEKIEALILSVESAKGAVFIRNGQEYDAATAAKHLRSKRRWAGKKITTAEQFIDKLATGSSQTGKPYVIRFKDGKELKSADFLNAELKRLDGNGRQGSAPSTSGK